MPTQRSPPATPGRPDVDRDLDDLCRTLENSRKRHLPTGLLRGDQAHDRLKAQEATASPILKKSRLSPVLPSQEGSPAMALTMADFEAYMEKNTNRRFDSLDSNITTIHKELGSVRKAVSENSAKIDKHQEIIEANQANIAELRSEVLNMKSAPPPSRWPAAPGGPTPVRSPASPPLPVRDPEYDAARRSLRLWPICGSSVAEMSRGVIDFVTQKLQVPDVGRDDLESVQSAKIRSGPRVKDEVLVKFREVEVRDKVLGAAAKLAPFMDDNGMATAGMRLEVPSRLQQDFRVLYKYGQSLRARHGIGTRRHIKFDDPTRSLFLNVKLPGDVSWSKVSTVLARRGIRARQIQTDDEIERRLDITGPQSLNDRPRAASLSSAPERPMETSSWPPRRSESVSS